MRKKDILELKKRYKKEQCTFTKMCGCYVNGEKNVLLKFRDTFLNIEEDVFHKYLEIAKKVLSGTIGNNLLELNFPLNEDLVNEKQVSLMALKNSVLKDDTLLDNFYDSIIDNFDYTGNYLIVVFHDAYDVITKTKDNLKLDESEEVYEYILCAICPVELSKAGLRYFEDENLIASRVRDWIVEAPTLGFVYPAFINRSSDVNSIMYYTKNPKDPHHELMEGALGCYKRQTATIQKEAFHSIIEGNVLGDEKKTEKLYMDIQENLSIMIEDYNAIYDDVESEPFTLTSDRVSTLLKDSGVSTEETSKIEKSFIKEFGEDLPLAESILDDKILKEKEKFKREENLIKQVKVLENKLREVENNTLEVALDKVENTTLEASENNTLEVSSDEIEVDSINEANEIKDDVSLETSNSTSVLLKVTEEKIPQIKYEVIDGQKCIVIPLNENEEARIEKVGLV
ncbi:MAG: DUF4317 domain-containing protein [Clostridium sp.]